MELSALFMAHFTKALAMQPLTLDEETLLKLRRYDWPGNVRELRNAIDHAAVACTGATILPEHLPAALRGERSGADRTAGGLARYVAGLDWSQPGVFDAAGAPLERALIAEALRRCNGNRGAAAELLGLHRNTLRKKIRQFGLDADAQ